MLLDQEDFFRHIEKMSRKKEERIERENSSRQISTGLLLGGDPLSGASPRDEVMEAMAERNREKLSVGRGNIEIADHPDWRTNSTVIPLPPGVELPSEMQREMENLHDGAWY